MSYNLRHKCVLHSSPSTIEAYLCLRCTVVLTISVGYQDLTNWPHPIWNSGILHNIRGSKPGQRGSDHGARTRSQHGRRPWRRGGQWRLWWWASTSAWRGSWPWLNLFSDKVMILSWVHGWAREPQSGRPAVKGFKYSLEVKFIPNHWNLVFQVNCAFSRFAWWVSERLPTAEEESQQRSSRTQAIYETGHRTQDTGHRTQDTGNIWYYS